MKIYYPYSEYLKTKYHEKVYKLPINLPVTCPNRLDGRGCAFCAGAGTGFEAMDSAVDVAVQMQVTRDLIEQKYHAKKFVRIFKLYKCNWSPKDFGHTCMRPQGREIS